MCRHIASPKLRHFPSDGRTPWVGQPATETAAFSRQLPREQAPDGPIALDRNAGVNASHFERTSVAQRKETW